jgi:hypothetical protein
MTVDEAIDVVIARSGHAAYRALCAEDNPDRAQRDAYRKIVLRRARGLARVVVPPQPDHTPGGGSRRLVVAAYTEDVSWVRAVPFPVTVYHHRDCLLVPGDIPCVPLPNVGREAHVYLTHIVGHYDDLDDYTVFSQGNPFEHSPDFLARISVHSRLTSLTTYYLPDRPAAAVKAFDRIEEVDGFVVRYGLGTAGHVDADGSGWLDRSIWPRVFACPAPDPWWFGYGASWLVPRACIRARPRWFWQRLLADCVAAGTATRSHSNPPLNPWAFEALWLYLFSDPAVYPHRARSGAARDERSAARDRTCAHQLLGSCACNKAYECGPGGVRPGAAVDADDCAACPRPTPIARA